ncbi:tRNA pseudouridine(55) synthase TruB [Gardnerella sp. DNF00550]|uniref:tRNA pseudouridine(55) synthase TruB n=1 Tax=Gardnerella sp. DNF00550 TaxID=2749051 RepID=UPI003BAF125D
MCIPDSGLLLVDKPQGVTSHDIVACARHLLHTKRVGHAGTLDPMATGLLIIGFGNATRLLNYMLGHDKTYEAVIRLGEATTTDDAEGEILPDDALNIGPGVHVANKDMSFEKSLSFERIKQVVSENLVGKIMQAPTAFSAIKINGQRAYDLAREGKSVEIAPREIFVSDFSVSNPRIARGVSGKLVCDISAKVSCSSGTYIRALARDLGRLLGVGGHLTQLRRTSVGDFSVTDSRVLKLRSQMREFTDRNGVLQHRSKAVPSDDFDANNMLPKICLNMMDAASHSLPTLSIDENQAKDLRFGRWIELKSGINYENYPAIAYVSNANTEECDVVAVVELTKNIKSNQIKPIVVFPASEKTGKLDKYLK